MTGMTHAGSWKAGGKRERILSDFLIGAHALHEEDWLLTRDRGFYHTYFSGLQILFCMGIIDRSVINKGVGSIYIQKLPCRFRITRKC